MCPGDCHMSHHIAIVEPSVAGNDIKLIELMSLSDFDLWTIG